MRGWHTATLSEEDVLAISKAIDEGEPSSVLAEDYEVSVQQINRIRSGQRWGKLTGRGRDTRRDDL